MPTGYRIPVVGGAIASLFNRFSPEARAKAKLPPSLGLGFSQKQDEEGNIVTPAVSDVEKIKHQQQQPAQPAGIDVEKLNSETPDLAVITTPRERSAPQRFVARPSKSGYGVDEGDAAFLAGEPKQNHGPGRPKENADVSKKKGGPVSKSKNSSAKSGLAKPRNNRSTSAEPKKKRGMGRPQEDATASKKKVGSVSKNKNKNPPAKTVIDKPSNDGSMSDAPTYIKPLHKVGSAVYAAYWPPHDKSRQSDPSWYPGVVSSFKTNKAVDNRYGHVRSYNIHFDDGDKLNAIPDHFVSSAEDYLLLLRHDGGRNNHSWLGVRNVTDKRSSDLWAQLVGWYVATINGKKQTFSSLSDGLRAYDTSVVRANGLATKESDLNLPEELFGNDAVEGTAIQDAGEVSKRPNPTKAKRWRQCKYEECTELHLSGCDGYCIAHKKFGIPVNKVKKATKQPDPGASNKRKRRDDPNEESDVAPPKKHPKNGVCTYEGCSKQVYRIGLCRHHGGAYICTFDGCREIVVNKGVCVRHSGKVKRTQCRMEGCTSWPRKGGVCTFHGWSPEIQKSRTCSQELCTARVREGLGFCVNHAAAAAQKPTCNHEGCRNVSKKAGGFCALHGKTGTSKSTCNHEGCTNLPRMAGGFCNRHAGKTTCSKEGCKLLALNAGFCKSHGGNTTCNHEGCTFKVRARGKCGKHDTGSAVCHKESQPELDPSNKRKRRVDSKEESDVAPLKKHSKNGVCTYEGCSKQVYRVGLCRHHGGSKICTFDGCTNTLVNSGVCVRHGAKITQKQCSMEGCTSLSRKGGLCAFHLLSPEIQKSRTCSHELCTTRVREGTGFCELHGKSTCNHEGCTNMPQRAGGLCKRHARKPTCCKEGCKLLANVAGFCKSHGGNSTCNHEGCTSKVRARGKCDKHNIESAVCHKESQPDKGSRHICITLQGKNQLFMSLSEFAQQVVVGQKNLTIEGSTDKAGVLCSHEGCINIARSGGACSFHNFRPSKTLCNHPGCIIPSHVRGKCTRHDNLHLAEMRKQRATDQCKRSWKDTE